MTEPEIIAFVSSEEHLGIPFILSALAAAISALDSRVILVGEASGEVRLFDRSGEPGYVLVDVPFRPSPLFGAVLSGSDLVFVAASCKLDYIDAAKNIVKELLFLGVAPAKTAAVLVDPDGMLPAETLDGMKAYLETSLGIKMACGISLDVEDDRNSSPVSLDGVPARDIFQLAGHILAHTRREAAPAALDLPAEISL